MSDSENGKLQQEIIRSTAIVGGSSGINVVLRIVQAKFVALLVGTDGTGTIGLFNSATGIASTIAGMGMNTSAVRQIAEAAAAGDEERVSRTVTAMRRAVLLFGILGAALFFLFRHQISRVTFGHEGHAPEIGWLSLVPLFGAIAGGQGALIRGMRRIGDLARASVFGAALGTALALPVLIIWREKGIALYLVTVAGAAIASSWWYARKVRLVKVPLSIRATACEAGGMVSLGVVLTISALVTTGTAYAVKVIIVRDLGISDAGLFEASSQISNVYVGFILGAMSADFFPHLASLSNDDNQSGRLINAQAEIGLLIATPGIIAAVALGPWILHLMYSSAFKDAFDILRWQAMGTFLRVVTWPIGFLFLARGKHGYFFLAQTAVNAVYLGLLYFGVKSWGREGIGPAFFGMYVFHTFFMAFLARRLIGFSWSLVNIKLISVSVPLVGGALASTYLLTPSTSAAIGVAISFLLAVYSLRRLVSILGPERVSRWKGRLLGRFMRK